MRGPCHRQTNNSDWSRNGPDGDVCRCRRTCVGACVCQSGRCCGQWAIGLIIDRGNFPANGNGNGNGNGNSNGNGSGGWCVLRLVAESQWRPLSFVRSKHRNLVIFLSHCWWFSPGVISNKSCPFCHSTLPQPGLLLSLSFKPFRICVSNVYALG